MKLLIVLYLVPFLGFATTISDLVPTKDATIYSESPGGNQLANGAGTFLFAGRIANGSGSVRRALIQYDLLTAGIPANAQIESVSLTLHVTREQRDNPGRSDFTLHRLTQNWTEGTSNPAGLEGTGVEAGSGDATWLHSTFGSTFWNTPGGDFLPTASATQPINNPAVDETFSGVGLVADVQAWIENPAQNFGWILIGDESTDSSARQFFSSVNTDDGPSLTITYNTIPEPSAVGLFVIGGLLILRNRMKV